jgi:TP901 family phage tail tape measure protein
MVLEELIAKLGFKVSGQSEAKKFIRQLEDIRKASKAVGKGFKVNFSGNTSGLSKVTRELERAAAAAKRFEDAARRASRVRMHPGGGRGPGSFRPTDGAGPGGGGPGGAGLAGAAAAGRLSRSSAIAGAAAAGAVGVIALKKFGALEQAGTELAITADKSVASIAPAIEMFRREGPKIGVQAKDIASVAQAFVAAGVDYDTAVGSSMATARAAKASYTGLDDAAQAGIVTVQNLGVSVGEMGKAFDIMIAGGKLGKAEFSQLASTLPQLAASGQKAGFKGTDGLRDLVAALEVVRESTPTTADAAIHLKDLLEKMTDPVTSKNFKKHAKVSVEDEFNDADKKGQSRLDRMLDITTAYTKGNPFRLAELFHEQQSRDALNALSTKRDKFNDIRGQIDKNASGTTETDLAKVMGTFNSSVDKFSAGVDRLMGRAGEAGAPLAKAIMDVAGAGMEGADSGKGSTDTQRNASVEKLNRLFGAPPTYKGRLGEYGGTTAKNFEERFGAAPPSSSPRSFRGAQPSGTTAPSFGSTGDRMDWMKKGAAATTTNNVTNNTNTGNDQRTQSASVTVNATGLAEVAALVKSSVQSGLSGLGASIVKGQTASTGASTAP